MSMQTRVDLVDTRNCFNIQDIADQVNARIAEWEKDGYELRSLPQLYGTDLLLLTFERKTPATEAHKSQESEFVPPPPTKEEILKLLNKGKEDGK